MMKKLIWLRNCFSDTLLLGTFPFLLFLSSCTEELPIKPFYEDSNSISGFLEESGETFSLFQYLIKAGGLESTLASYNPHGNGYSLFLPTNEAIEKFVADHSNYVSFQDLINDLEYVKTLVRYHVVNIALNTNDFSYGVLPDTTLSGDLLTIGFSGGFDATVQKVNNYASIIHQNIQLTNGYIHIIDQVLSPMVDNSYEWLKQKPEFEIFTRALEITGLKNLFVNKNGGQTSPAYTLFVESDKIFGKKGILTINHLIDRYSPDKQDYTNESNNLYQFIAYHIIEGKKFLNDFENKDMNYNTSANLPISINAMGMDIKINTGVGNLDTLINNNDTTIINYVRIDYDISNVMTLNGAIHFIKDIMELFRPLPREQIFQFYEEPLINAAQTQANTYYFKKPEDFTVISWQGVKEIKYVKSSTNLPGVWNNDYLEIEGDFTITYEIPRILPGKYMLKIRANGKDTNNAFIRVTLDNQGVGDIIDLTTSPGSSVFYTYNIGHVNFSNYEKHQIKIQTIISGRFLWDGVVFTPLN